jgi:lipoprotein-anchoring transpeptidase ErfK/SrfK
MSTIKAIGGLTALIAAAALTCGTARAEPLFFLFGPPPQAQTFVQPEQPQAAPHDEAAPSDEANEDTQLAPRLQRQVVDYPSREAPGTVIVDTPHTFLYYVLGGGKAIRYGIGVGRKGFTWSGVKSIVRKQEWPDWYPPPEMVARQPYLPRMIAGGPGNPLGARAMYIGGTEYRIHGTNDPSSIGKFMSSGCIRMTNDNAIDLYNRVRIGAKVIVLPMQGAPQREAKAPMQQANVPAWQAKAQAAIERSRQSAPQHSSYAPADGSRAHVSWNAGPPGGLY